ncbi:hypothetical protein LPW26_16920 [Rhodopseudomonas sp. HC1]|uniref:hypothetical protein n=1 Tax=Rhodopseudomonas infernalis TaxID=2897386 RepID=UPI001EE831B0|nr:hypothetical protein [Rhodopseudomonas infernalis]MCG6206333.1 hypothetical protein [Rhodopseudomonas infernalis]
MGRKAASIRGMYNPKSHGQSEGSDLDDICIIAFNDSEKDFFDGVYDLDNEPAIASEPAHRLIATGFLKQRSHIDPPNIFVGLGFLEFRDAGVAQFDHALRRGLATYTNPGFSSIAGMSGSPVYSLNNEALCGMVARGVLEPNGGIIVYFIDIFDILQFLDAVVMGSPDTSYTKDPLQL